MARTKIERRARAHEVTIVIAAARAFDLGRLCDSRAICRHAAWSSNRHYIPRDNPPDRATAAPL